MPTVTKAGDSVMTMLRMEDVKKSYRQPNGEVLPVLEIPHFEVAAGAQVVIRGPSGGGKTTLLHAIAGISQVDQGRIEIAGIDITRLPESGRDRFRARNIGYVFQTFNLLQGFSALENVLLAMTFTHQHRDRHRALGLLDKVGIAQRAAHRPAALSVGEQQRVAVARALVNRPKLLLADEPTANIDTHHQQQVVDLIRSSCHRENVALLLVTHAPEVASQFDDVRLLEQFNRVTDPVR